jgi:hypothetical protein
MNEIIYDPANYKYLIYDSIDPFIKVLYDFVKENKIPIVKHENARRKVAYRAGSMIYFLDTSENPRDNPILIKLMNANVTLIDFINKQLMVLL